MCAVFTDRMQEQRPRANSQYAMTVAADKSQDHEEIAAYTRALILTHALALAFALRAGPARAVAVARA